VSFDSVEIKLGNEVKCLYSVDEHLSIDFTVRAEKVFEVKVVDSKKSQVVGMAESCISWLDILKGKSIKTSIFLTRGNEEAGFFDVELTLYKIKGVFEVQFIDVALAGLAEDQSYVCNLRCGMQNYEVAGLVPANGKLAVKEVFPIRLVNLDREIEIVFEDESRTVVGSCSLQIEDLILEIDVVRVILFREHEEVGYLELRACF
jgi:hypothetical protein